MRRLFQSCPSVFPFRLSYRRSVGGDEEGAVLVGADDEVGAVGPRVAARDGVREVGQHAGRLPRLLRLGGGRAVAEAAAAAAREPLHCRLNRRTKDCAARAAPAC